MKKLMLFAALVLGAAMIFATPQKANAAVVVGVHVGVGAPFYHRPGYFVAPAPRPYFGYAHPYAFAPAFVPRARFYGYVGPRYVAPYRFRADYRYWRR